MSAPTLWDPDPTENRVGSSRRTDPWTSKAAAKDNYPRSGTQRHRVLVALSRFEFTDFELSERLHILRGVAAKRRQELQNDDFVEPAGYTRATDTNCQALVWRITDAGREALRKVES